MTYKQIEASREARLWIKDVIVPAATVVVATMAIPEVRESAIAKFNETREAIKNKFKKD